VSVEHAEVATSVGGTCELVDELGSGFGAIGGGELELNLSGLGNDVVLAAVLITIGVTANNNRLGPAGNETRDILDNDGLTEDGTVKDIADGAVG
jgi:hypothetical protein